ncbi:MAG: LytTR family DNA-binding domain-containing protein [Bacteroidota bacterium]|nr:LytTR family DNA-binding domain-containing protein [Bacteroidota bacterium]
MINAILIDDEERARDSLRALLTSYCPNVNIVAECANVPDGVLAINQKRPQLVFLDIEMPEYNGFELLSFFREVDFEIIFVTAYNEYALKAFEVSAVDYILKPVDIDKLQVAVEKAESRLNTFDMQNRLEVLRESFKTEQFNKIALPVSEGLLFVDTADIVYLEADGAYTEVWLRNGSKIVVSKKIKFFEDVLDKRPNFFRSHRSYLVNINFIKKYNKSDNALTLDNGKTIVISRDRKAEFEQQLKNNNLTIG